MDIDKVQKINQLAKELMDHHMAESREEAVAKAEKMLSGKEMTELEEKMKPLEESPIHEDTLIRKLSRTIEEHTLKIEQLRRAITELENKLESMSRQQIQRPQVSNEHILTEAQRPDKQMAFTKEATEKKEHPRSGNYEPGDVSIEKIFYAGNK